MRLAVLNLTGGSFSGGYKKNLVRLLPRFEQKDPGLRMLTAAPPGVTDPAWFPALERTAFADCRPFSPLPWAADPALRAELDRFKPDVLFAPLERFYDYPGRPYVCMLVNMAPMARNYGGLPLSEKLRQAVQRWHSRRAVTRADHVVVTSRFVKNFLTSEWGLPPGKISVIYPGADQSEGPERRPAALAERGWNRFFWTIGSLEKYRGVEDILDAMLLPGALEARLVMCCSVRPGMRGYEREVLAGIERRGLGDRVLWVKGLTEGELAWCYRNAEAFIMTSRIEAGPNTALEALAAGAATIAAENPPLPEFFGDTALYYPPGDAAALAERMASAGAREAAERERLSALAMERSKLYTWDYAAARMLELFRRLSSGG